MPLAATCTLGEIMELSELCDIAQNDSYRLVCTLLLRVGITNEAAKPKKTEYANISMFLYQINLHRLYTILGMSAPRWLIFLTV